jgi:hypothetical protein
MTLPLSILPDWEELKAFMLSDENIERQIAQLGINLQGMTQKQRQDYIAGYKAGSAKGLDDAHMAYEGRRRCLDEEHKKRMEVLKAEIAKDIARMKDDAR